MPTPTQPLAPAELAAVITRMHEGVQVIDRQFRYVFVNEAAAGHGRSTGDALMGRSMMEAYPGIARHPDVRAPAGLSGAREAWRHGERVQVSRRARGHL